MNFKENFLRIESMKNSFEQKQKLLEEKLIERDRGTLVLTQKLEEQVLHLKEDFHQKHLQTIQQKDVLIQKSLQQIQDLHVQIQVRSILLSTWIFFDSIDRFSSSFFRNSNVKRKKTKKNIIETFLQKKISIEIYPKSNLFFKRYFLFGFHYDERRSI